MNWFVAVTVIVLPLLATAMYVAQHGRKRSLSAHRMPMGMEEIHQEHYASLLTLDAFLVVWNDVAECLGVDPALLRPEDRFGVDVGLAAITTDELDELAGRAALHAKNASHRVGFGRVEDCRRLRPCNRKGHRQTGWAVGSWQLTLG